MFQVQYYPASEQQRCRSDCTNVLADLSMPLLCAYSSGLPHNLNMWYTIFSKIANIIHHLSQEYDDIGWL